jgi:ABC-type cobalamin/Fe3+-siderophores transport system ATPase subunit
MEMTRHYLGKDDLEEAELSYYKYKEVAQGISYYPNPFSDEAIRLWWEYTDEELLRFPGYLGKYLAPICRGQLIGVMGPPKRGKTTLLTEFACIALMHKLKVVFFSLEMNRNKINQKIMTRIAGRPKFPEKYQDLRIPVMDCLKNQTGECRYPQRNNKINLLGEDGKIMGYDPKLDGRYKPCTYCLKKGSDDYVFAVWYQTKRYQHATMKDFQNIRDDFKQIFGGNNLIVEAYPIGTFSCKDLENRLTLLEQEKKIFFDCICIDYADIMKKEDRRERRLEIGSIWEQLAALSQKKNCLVVTASQTNRAATNKADLTMEDLAEDYSKAMIADMFLAINQTSQEKDNSILRIATVLHRHRGFSLHHQCRVIQAPEIGQFSLGSCGAARKLTR